MKKLLAIICIFLGTSTLSIIGMESTNQDIESVFTVCRDGNYQEVEKYLKEGFDPNQKFNTYGDPYLCEANNSYLLLHTAAERGYDSIVELLLTYSADVDQHAAMGNKFTALHLAACNTFPLVVKQLLHAGADANALDCFGQTPLHFTRKGIKEPSKIEKIMLIITMLRTYGAQNDTISISLHRSPFHLSHGQDSSEFLYSLLIPLKNDRAKKDARNRLKTLLLVIKRLFPKNGAFSKEMVKTLFSYLPVDCYHANIESLGLPGFYKKGDFEKHWLKQHLCSIKELAQGDASKSIKTLKACMSAYEIGAIQVTLDTKDTDGNKPVDYAHDSTVKTLLNPRSWKLPWYEKKFNHASNAF